MKPIPGFEGYFISEYGVVYNAKGYAMKDYDNGNGYRLIRLYVGRVNGKSTYKNKYIYTDSWPNHLYQIRATYRKSITKTIINLTIASLI